MAESVKVIVRCRPMNEREKNLKCKACISCDERVNKVSIFKPDEKSFPPKNFTFDGAYFTNSTTKQIYEDVGFALVDGVLEGYNGTVFAYGQTGCGKSFSMQGVVDPPEQKGIIPRSFEHIFESIDVDEGNTNFLVQASYLEIYNEEIRDLLGKDTKQRLELRESPDSGVYTQNLSQHIVTSLGECIKLMEKGWMSRSTGATLMNAESSRSHSIFAIRMEMCTNDDENDKIKVGKLNLVDLAGSERQGKTGATGERLREATKINLSLSALGNVISALVDGKSKHIPYRDSKLTRLLQDSLGGNTKTMMVACISPADNNYDETLSTLRYANRAKNIKNKPKINEDPKDALLREYAEEIARLKAMLEGKLPVQIVNNEEGGVQHDESREEDLRREYEEQIAQLNQKYEEEKMTKEKLNEELDTLKYTYESKRKESCDMAISPFKLDNLLEHTGTSPMLERDEEYQDHTPLDVQSVSSINTPFPAALLSEDEQGEENTLQLTIKQAECLSSKQLSNLGLTPGQVRMLGYDGPVTPAHVACLPLTRGQVMQLELTTEQKSLLTPQQSSAVAKLDAQCEDLAYNQLLSYVNLLKNTEPLQLTFEQAQTLSSEQLSALVLNKEQSKQNNGASNAQELTLEQIARLQLTPAQVATLKLTEEQLEEMDDDQFEAVEKVTQLMKRQELMCLLSEPKLQNPPTVTLTSAQATQLDAKLVKTMPLTDMQTQIIKEYKDSFTHTEVSDLDQLPLLPHQVKHLKVQESCILDKPQTQKVGKSIETQTYVENSAISTMVDMEEGLTKAVTLTPGEAASITTEQLAKIQVAVSQHSVAVEAGVAESLTLTPLEIHQMQLTEEQRQKIKAKKLKRIDKHAKVIVKLKKQTAALVELTDTQSPEPHLVLSTEQALQVKGSVGPTKEQQDALHIEPGRHLDSEDLGGVVLSAGQMTQLAISSDSVLNSQQKEAYQLAKQKLVKQDVLKRLKDTAPLTDLEITLSETQVRTLTEEQVQRLRLTEEQCDALGMVPGQNICLSEVSLISLNGQQILQLKLSENQMSMLSIPQKQVVNNVVTSAIQELAYLNTTEEEGMLVLTLDQTEVLSEEQIANLTLTPSQLAKLGKSISSVVTPEDISRLALTKSQLEELNLSKQQKSMLSQSQKEELALSMDVIEQCAILRDALRITGSTQQYKETEKKPEKPEIQSSNPEIPHESTQKPPALPASPTAPSPPKQPDAVAVLQVEVLSTEPSDIKIMTKQHQEALLKLQQLQGNVVTAGADLQVRSSKKEIREKLARRRDAAAAKKRKLRVAMEQGNEEGVIEELFNLQVGEVEVRDKKLSKIKDKYKEKMNEITDLTQEFETQRADYLDSIREQSKESKLLEQILQQVQPLLRRDSNYYNLDAIKKDSRWSEESGCWLVPPVMISQTKLPAQQQQPATNGQGLIQPSYMDLPDDTRIRAKLSTTAANSDYFKTSRQQRLLEENRMLQGNGYHGNNRLSTDSLSKRNVLHPIKKNKHS